MSVLFLKLKQKKICRHLKKRFHLRDLLISKPLEFLLFIFIRFKDIQNVRFLTVHVCLITSFFLNYSDERTIMLNPNFLEFVGYL